MNIEIYKGSPNELIDLIYAWKAECNLEEFGLEENVFSMVRDLGAMIYAQNGFLFVIRQSGAFLGLFGAYIINIETGDDLVLKEHYWYVLPEYRAIGGIRLLKAVQKFAKENGCSHILTTASMLASDQHDKVCKLYEKLGMKKYETSYIKQL